MTDQFPNEDPLTLQTLEKELRAFGLFNGANLVDDVLKGEKEFGSTQELFEDLEKEILVDFRGHGSIKENEFEVMSQLIKDLMAKAPDQNEIWEIGNWYRLQIPDDGLKCTYADMRDLKLEETKKYLELTCDVFTKHWGTNAKETYDFFHLIGDDTLGKDEIDQQLNEYFTMWKKAQDGTPDLSNVCKAIGNKDYDFIGDNAIKFQLKEDDEVVFEDSFNVNSFVNLCTGLELKIRQISLIAHMYLVREALLGEEN